MDAGSGVMAPYADAAPADLDERILAVEIARPLIPAADEQRYYHVWKNDNVAKRKNRELFSRISHVGLPYILFKGGRMNSIKSRYL